MLMISWSWAGKVTQGRNTYFRNLLIKIQPQTHTGLDTVACTCNTSSSVVRWNHPDGSLASTVQEKRESLFSKTAAENQFLKAVLLLPHMRHNRHAPPNNSKVRKNSLFNLFCAIVSG